MKLLTFTGQRTISYKNQQAWTKITTAANLAKVIEFYQFYLVSYMGGGVTFYASLQKTLSTLHRIVSFCFLQTISFVPTDTFPPMKLFKRPRITLGIQCLTLALKTLNQING